MPRAFRRGGSPIFTGILSFRRNLGSDNSCVGIPSGMTKRSLEIQKKSFANCIFFIKTDDDCN